MRVGRRAAFFAAIAAACLAMLALTPSEFWWLNLVMAGLGAFWSLAFMIEDVSTARHEGRRAGRDEKSMKEEP